jgi:hypothetical protein
VVVGSGEMQNQSGPGLGERGGMGGTREHATYPTITGATTCCGRFIEHYLLTNNVLYLIFVINLRELYSLHCVLFFCTNFLIVMVLTYANPNSPNFMVASRFLYNSDVIV